MDDQFSVVGIQRERLHLHNPHLILQDSIDR
jgi:hypothetical protein